VDKGRTWRTAVDAQWGLTCDRNHVVSFPDSRKVIVFRNTSPGAKDNAGFIGLGGACKGLKQSEFVQYGVSLQKIFQDGLYPGFYFLHDDTTVATTCETYRKKHVDCSIVNVSFKMSEVVASAA
jgi:hypothetical protein